MYFWRSCSKTRIVYWCGNYFSVDCILMWELLFSGLCTDVGTIVQWIVYWWGNYCSVDCVLMWELLFSGLCTDVGTIVQWIVYWCGNYCSRSVCDLNLLLIFRLIQSLFFMIITSWRSTEMIRFAIDLHINNALSGYRDRAIGILITRA